MKYEFDLQRFAEDSEDIEETADVEEQTTDTKNQGEPEEQEPIPEELAGLDEKYAREAMKEWKEIQAQQAQTQTEEQQSQPQPQTEEQAQNQQQTVDETTALKNEVAQLKAQIAQMTQSQQSQQPQRQPPPPPAQPPQPQFSKEQLEMIKAAIKNEAFRISGFTQEDIDGFEFADDGDEKLERWKYAQAMAQNNVMNTVRQAQQAYYQQQERTRQQHLLSQQSFNAFVDKESKEKDFQQVINHSLNDYFATLQPQEQEIVGAAYYRIDKQLATPQDAWIVQNYFLRAKADYRSKSSQPKTTVRTSKSTQPPKLPKSDLLQGTSTVDATISNAELEHLIDTGQLDKIPKSIRNYLESADIFHSKER